MLRTQPIKAPRVLEADYYSVMSRHALNDGITPDVEIDLTGVTHLPLLAPPSRLVGDWYRGRLGVMNSQTFNEAFAPRYLDWLSEHEAEVCAIGDGACATEVVLMCIEPTSTCGEVLLCHRRLLAEEVLRLTSELDAYIA